ncbi:MAG: hypothetical protein FWE69_07575, partial [Clostridiales bacterium]|nr:hypothetical protein [Clostridiales bacterium]
METESSKKTKLAIPAIITGAIVIFLLGAFVLVGLHDGLVEYLAEQQKTLANEEPTIEDFLGADGVTYKRVLIYLNPGDSVTLHLPYQDDFTQTNESGELLYSAIDIHPNSHYPPDPLPGRVYTLAQELTLTRADGTQTHFVLGPFDMPPLATPTPRPTPRPTPDPHGPLTLENFPRLD